MKPRAALATLGTLALVLGLAPVPAAALGAAPASPIGSIARPASAATPASALPAKKRASKPKAKNKKTPRIAKVRAVTARVGRGEGALVSAKVVWNKRGKKAMTTVTYVLATSAKKRKGDKRLGVATGLGKKVTARAVVRVPRRTKPGTYRLLACVGKTCTAGKKPLKVIKPKPTSATKIAKADKTKKLKADKAILFRYYALYGDKRLPKKYRGAKPTGYADTGIGRDAVTRWESMSAKMRKKILPFLLPPTLEGSAYGLAGGYKRTPRKSGKVTEPAAAERPGGALRVAPPGRGVLTASSMSRHATAAKPEICSDKNPMDRQASIDEFWDRSYAGTPSYQAVDTADGKARIWHRAPRDGEVGYESDAGDARLARQIAAYLPGLWKKFHQAMGREPVSDAGHPCFDGGDGRLDIYLYPGVSLERKYMAHETVHVWFDKPSCQGPSWITLVASPTKWAVAHELFHAFQNAFLQKGTNCDTYAELDEGSASWAATMGVPGDTYHHTDSGHVGLLATTFHELYSSRLISRAYAYWPLWMYLAKINGNSVIGKIYAQREKNDQWHAVDKGVPGGLVKQWPGFARAAWNTARPARANPFVLWDRWPENPYSRDEVDERTLRKGAKHRVGYKLFWRGRAYIDIAVDPKVRTLQIDNPGHADKTASLQAFLQYRDGHWKYEDYSTQDQIRFCPDRKEDELQRVVLITARADVKNSANSKTTDRRPLVTADADCSPHYQVTAINGSFDLTYELGRTRPPCHVQGREFQRISLDPAPPSGPTGDGAIESDKVSLVDIPALVHVEQNYGSDCDYSAGHAAEPCISKVDIQQPLWWASFYRPDGAKNATVTLPLLTPRRMLAGKCPEWFGDGAPAALWDEPNMQATVPWSTIAGGKPFTVTVRQGPYSYSGSDSNETITWSNVRRSWSITFSPLKTTRR